MTLLLPDEDIEYLNDGFPGQWENISENGMQGIVIKDYELPQGYTVDKADLMVLIPPEYPVGELDMFYFSPDLARKDGKGIGNLAPTPHFSRSWQQWSRHYDWEPGQHNLISHISFIHNQMKFDAQ